MVCQSPVRRQSLTRSIANVYSTTSGGCVECSDGLLVVQSPSFGGHMKKRLRTRTARREATVSTSTRGVKIDLALNQIHTILSLDDYTEEEFTATFYTRNEFRQMKRVIRQTVNYLKTPPPSPTSPQQQFQNQRGADTANNTGLPSPDVIETDGTVCVRGLECLVDDFVGSHRKRVRIMSQSAVFEYQHMVKYNQQLQLQEQQSNLNYNRQKDQDGDFCMMSSQSESSPSPVEDDSTVTKMGRHAIAASAAADGIAQAYSQYTNGCQSIAEKWGHFDAIDAAY